MTRDLDNFQGLNATNITDLFNMDDRLFLLQSLLLGTGAEAYIDSVLSLLQSAQSAALGNVTATTKAIRLMAFPLQAAPSLWAQAAV